MKKTASLTGVLLFVYLYSFGQYNKTKIKIIEGTWYYDSSICGDSIYKEETDHRVVFDSLIFDIKYGKLLCQAYSNVYNKDNLKILLEDNLKIVLETITNNDDSLEIHLRYYGEKNKDRLCMKINKSDNSQILISNFKICDSYNEHKLIYHRHIRKKDDYVEGSGPQNSNHRNRRFWR